MAKNAIKINKHRPLQGYEVCIHTCGCRSTRGRASPLWHREGGSCVRHSQRKQNHPDCNVSCPGHGAWEPNSRRDLRTKAPTRKEIVEHLPTDEAELELKRLGLPPLLSEETQPESSNADNDIAMDVDDVDPDDEMQVEQDLEPHVAQSTLSIASGEMSSGSSRDPGPSHRLGRQSMASSSKSSLFVPTFATPEMSRSPSRSPAEWYPVVMSEEKRFRVVYIPDPSRTERRTDAEGHLGWTKREITFAHYDAIRHLAGFVYKVSENKRGVKVLIAEWLWLFITVDEFEEGTAFDVEFMEWGTFRDTILDPLSHVETWSRLAEMDCIIGGIDYAIDYRRVENAYDLDENTLRTYEAHVTQLASQTQFWPPIRPAQESGNKWTTIGHLQMIAKKTGRYAPATLLLKEGQEIPSGVVLKRSNSECGNHVILPDCNARRRTWKYLNNATSTNSFWMAQEYVPSLAKLGEWRVVIIGGKIITVMHSWKVSAQGDWKGRQIDTFLMLNEISRIVEKAPQPLDFNDLRERIVNPQHGPETLREHGKKEFHEFVLGTWRELVLRETRDTGGKPSICVFCRLDVGIRIDPSGEGEPQYFINEVERSTATSLWLYNFVRGTMRTLGDTFAMVFKQWLKDVQNPYIL